MRGGNVTDTPVWRDGDFLIGMGYWERLINRMERGSYVGSWVSD
jgi:hypothetical protein